MTRRISKLQIDTRINHRTRQPVVSKRDSFHLYILKIYAMEKNLLANKLLHQLENLTNELTHHFNYAASTDQIFSQNTRIFLPFILKLFYSFKLRTDIIGNYLHSNTLAKRIAFGLINWLSIGTYLFSFVGTIAMVCAITLTYYIIASTYVRYILHHRWITVSFLSILAIMLIPPIIL